MPPTSNFSYNIIGRSKIRRTKNVPTTKTTQNASKHGTTESPNTSRDHQWKLQKGPPKQQQATKMEETKQRRNKQRRKHSKKKRVRVNLKKITQTLLSFFSN